MNFDDPRTRWLIAAAGVLIAVLAWQRDVIGESTLLWFGLLIPSIVLHEVSHGAVALFFGDHTAQRAGRLTLNPVSHVDPLGTIVLPAILVLSGAPAFGWAKPVPVTLSNLRNPRGQALLVSLAGPATNLAVMGFATLVFMTFRPYGLLGDALLVLGLVNLVLAVFNLIPLPPLDGSAVLERFMPRSWWPGYLRFREYSMFILLGVFLLVPGGFGRILKPAVRAWLDFLS